MIALMVSLPISFSLSISSVTQSVTHDSATISYTTDEEVSSEVLYGTTPATINNAVTDAAPKTDHSVVINGLMDERLYYYQIIADNGVDTVTKSHYDSGATRLQFKTDAIPDTDFPTFSKDVSLTLQSDTQAVVTWTTSEPTDAAVFYGTNQHDLSLSQTQSNVQSAHSVTFGVEAGKQYFYKVKSCDGSGNCVESDIRTFVAKTGINPTAFEVYMPEKYGKRSIEFSGNTTPVAYIKLYVNDEWKTQTTADALGRFKFAPLILTPYGDVITFRFEIRTQEGNIFDESYVMEVNYAPPNLKMEDVPRQLNQSTSLELRGTVDQLVTLSIQVSSNEDVTPPAQVKDLVYDNVGTNSVLLRWTAVADSDLHEYAIYRDGVRITTVRGTEFQDIGGTVGSGQTYIYSVAAVDQDCNEGLSASPLRVTTSNGGFDATADPAQADLTCDRYDYQDSFPVSGAFSRTISLAQGMNNVYVVATNEYGNSAAWNAITGADTLAPRIIESNIEELSPSYISDVEVVGVVSEQATVLVYVNGNLQKKVNTDADGNFKADVQLSRDSSLAKTPTTGTGGSTGQTVTGNYATEWENEIQLVAVDGAGLQSDPLESKVTYAMCGSGSWFHVKLHDKTPDMLNPRLILEGMAQSFISVDVEWAGGEYYTGEIIGSPKVRARSLSLDEQDHWDTNWLTPGSAWDTRNRTQQYGTIIFNIPAKDPSNGGNWTTLEKEQNISSHRKGLSRDEGGCVINAFGCIRYPLEIEVTFRQNHLNYTQVQKTCVDVEMTIEDRIPTDYIPEDFLKSSINFLNGTIEIIDAVLEPLKTVSLYTLYACMVSLGVQFIMSVSEAWSCQFNSVLVGLLGESFSIAQAQAGLCEYTNSEECQDCQDAIEQRVEFQQTMKNICDRVMCPSAPTFQTFVDRSKEKLEREMEGLSAYKAATTPQQQAEALKGMKLGFKRFDDDAVSYDCALLEGSANQYLLQNAGPGLGLDDDSVCTGLHPPNAKCCKADYLANWDSACLFMDEFKESACLANQYLAKDDPSTIHVGSETVQCNRLWNAVAGFCEPDGSIKPDIINTGLYINDKYVEESPNDFVEYRYNNKLYVLVSKPQEFQEGEPYYVQAGYLSKDIDLAVDADQADLTGGDGIAINSQSVFIPFRSTDGDLSQFFSPEEIEKRAALSGSLETESYKSFAVRLQKLGCTDVKPTTAIPDMKGGVIYDKAGCTANSVLNLQGTGLVQAKSIYQDIENKLGISDKEYIVDPTSSMLRSAQCACLPALKSYLTLYRSVLMAVKNCFETILATGDGSSGMCRAVLSVYVCDLLYDAIRCFMEKYGSTGARASEGASLGNFFGAVTQASNKISSVAQGRYGGTQMFNTMFGESKLAHSVCMFAFTGTWDLDVAGMMENGYSVPIASTGAVYPCERRFVGYQQNNDGIATWNYHVGAGMVAGADLTYNLKATCSNTMTCNPQEGFPGGRCDCAGFQERETILRSGQLIAGESWTEEVFDNIQHDIRYDTVTLEWFYEDNNGQTVTDSVTCEMDQRGGNPPAFCGFDFSEGRYLCGYNYGENGYARFTGTPEPLYGNGQRFYVGEIPKFRVPLTMKIPQNSQEDCRGQYCQHSKFVQVELAHPNGMIIGQSPIYLIEQEERHDMDLDYGVKLLAQNIQGRPVFKHNGNYGTGIPGLDLERVTPTIPENTYLYVGREANQGQYKARESSTDLGPPETSNDVARVLQGGEFAGTVGDGYISYNSMNIPLLQSDNDPSNNWAAELFYQALGSDYCGTQSEVTLTATFRIYNAKPAGSSYEVDLSSVAYHEGEEQRKSIEVKAICKEQDDSTTGKACPSKMDQSWDSYSELNGYSQCTCNNKRTCERIGPPTYCNPDGQCTTTPALDCPQIYETNPAPADLNKYYFINGILRDKCVCDSTENEICGLHDNEYCQISSDDDVFCVTK